MMIYKRPKKMTQEIICIAICLDLNAMLMPNISQILSPRMAQLLYCVIKELLNFYYNFLSAE